MPDGLPEAIMEHDRKQFASMDRARMDGSYCADLRSIKRFITPYPPSANVYWRTRVIIPRKGPAFASTYCSGEATKFKATVKKSYLMEKPIKSPVILSIDIYRPRKSGDLSNRLKVLEDALCGIAYVDDKQVRGIHMTLHDDKENPRAEIVVEEIA